MMGETEYWNVIGKESIGENKRNVDGGSFLSVQSPG